MARAETIESAGETGGGGGGGSGPLPRHNTCRMELPGPFHTWPGLLTSTTISTGSGVGALHPYNHHHHPPPPVYLPYPLPYPQDEPQPHQQPPASSPSQTPPPSPLCPRRAESGGGAADPSAFSGEPSDSDTLEHREASSRQGPLPDLLPQNEHPSWALPPHRAPRGEAVQELEVRRVASQLRAIGDEFNATVLRRAHAAPHWQDWTDGCRRLLNLITQTLSTLYRLT